MSASAVKSPRFLLAEDGAGNSKPNEMSEHYRAINLDSNRSAESAGALLWVTEHPNTLLLDIYFPERSRWEVLHRADGRVRPCIISAIRELCCGTFLRSPVQNNPRVSFLQREVFVPGAGQRRAQS